MTVLLTLGVALIGVGGVAIGAWLNQRGAAAAVKQSFEGQRLLARDAALRDYRKQQIAPYIEAAHNRTRLWLEIADATGANDKNRLLSLTEQLLDPHFNNLLITSLVVPNDAFKTAFQRLKDAEGTLKPSYTKEEIRDVMRKMSVVLVDINRAAEHFLNLR